MKQHIVHPSVVRRKRGNEREEERDGASVFGLFMTKSALRILQTVEGRDRETERETERERQRERDR